MTTETAPLPIARRQSLRAYLSADALAITGITALSVAITVATWRTWGSIGQDTGYDVVAGARVASGEVPYVDFPYYYGPLAPFVLGFAFLVFGESMDVAIGFGLALTTVIVFSTYAVARMYADVLGSAIATAIVAAIAFAPNNLSFVVPHTTAATLGVLGLLVLLLGLGRYRTSGHERWLVVAGASAGLVALTKPEMALAAAAAIAVWLAPRWRAGALGRRLVLAILVPALLIPVTIYGAFLTSVSPRELVLENLYPVDFLNAGGDAIVDNRVPFSLESVLEVVGRLALYAAGTAVLVGVGLGISRSSIRRPLIAVAGIAVALAVTGAIVNPEALRRGLQFTWGWIPAGATIALAWLLWRSFRRARHDQEAGWALPGLAVLFVMSVTVYAAFFLHATRPQHAVYAAPFAAIFLVYLHLTVARRERAVYALGAVWLAFVAGSGVGLTLLDAGEKSAVVSGPGGSLKDTPANAAVYRDALASIASGSSAGEPILLAPQLTALYVLGDRPNPLPQISLLPGVLAGEQEELDAIARLEQAGVGLAITDRREYDEYGHTSFGGSFDRTLAAWIESNFVHQKVLRADQPQSRTLDVWSRGKS